MKATVGDVSGAADIVVVFRTIETLEASPLNIPLKVGELGKVDPRRPRPAGRSDPRRGGDLDLLGPDGGHLLGRYGPGDRARLGHDTRDLRREDRRSVGDRVLSEAVRLPAVAGLFYEGGARALRAEVEGYLSTAGVPRLPADGVARAPPPARRARLLRRNLRGGGRGRRASADRPADRSQPPRRRCGRRPQRRPGVEDAARRRPRRPRARRRARRGGTVCSGSTVAPTGASTRSR